MQAINANFSYSTKIISCEPFKCLCFLMFLKRQYCVRTSVCVSLASVFLISRWQEVMSSVCGGLQWGSVFSVRTVEKIIFVQLERVKKPQKKNSSSSAYIEFFNQWIICSMAQALQIAGNAQKCKYNVRIYVLF